MIADLPEFLIRGKERGYLEWFLRRKAANPLTFSEADLDEYLRILRAKVACAQGWLTIALPPSPLRKTGRLANGVNSLFLFWHSVPIRVRFLIWPRR